MDIEGVLWPHSSIHSKHYVVSLIVSPSSQLIGADDHYWISVLTIDDNYVHHIIIMVTGVLIFGLD